MKKSILIVLCVSVQLIAQEKKESKEADTPVPAELTSKYYQADGALTKLQLQPAWITAVVDVQKASADIQNFCIKIGKQVYSSQDGKEIKCVTPPKVEAKVEPKVENKEKK